MSNSYLITCVSFFDTVSQPVRIQCVIQHDDPQKAVNEVLHEVSPLLRSCLRSISVTKVNESTDVSSLSCLPEFIIR